MRRALLLIGTFLGLVTATVGVMAPAPAFAATTPKQEVCRGIGGVSGTGTTDCSGGPSLNGVIRTVINIFSIVIGVTAVIMVMVAGFKYITSSGDSGSISSAKNTLVYAIVGLVVAALAQFIVKFVLAKVK